MDNIIKEFQLKYPKLTKDMMESSHHYSPEHLNPYHLEGDVFAHTMMVCLEAKKAGLSRSNQIACLLHDIGKPACRKENKDKERVNFYGHESYSAYLAIDIMRDFGLSDKQIIHNFQLIAVHTEVFKLTDKQLSERFVNNHKLLSDLMLISRCDREGRFFEIPDQGANKFPKAGFEMTEGHDKEVVVMVGLPCSGKSTVREEYSDHEVLSRDDIVEELGKGANYTEKFNSVDQDLVNRTLEARKKQLIKEGKDVIIDMTNLSRKSRRRNLSGFPKEYRRKAVVCLVGMGDIYERNEKRYAETGKYIPLEVFDKMIQSTYPPMNDEFDTIEWRLT